MIGEVIKDFVITGALGHGAMGEVFVGEQRIVKTKVAIKMLMPAISADEEQVTRFFNEAVAVSKIRHAGTVKIFDVGFHAGRAYLVMEFLEGEPLSARIAKGRLPLPKVVDVARQIASVLEATHAVGIVHRDLKPDNIFLVPDVEVGERVRVLDFGIAKLADTKQTAASSRMGTPLYMAPELWGEAETSDARTDVYALGCIVFELCAGRPPFVARSMAEACAMHVSEEPPRLRSLAPAAPAVLDALVARMLAKPRDERPATRDVVQALAKLDLADVGTEATLPPPATGTAAATAPPVLGATTPPRRSRAPLVALLAIGAAGAIGGIAYVATRGGGDPETAPVVAKSTPTLTPTPTPTPTSPPPTAPPPPTSAVPDAEVAAATATADGLVLSYRVLVQPTPGAEFRSVEPNEALRTGMHVAFAVRVSELAHVYLSQRTKGKRVSVLFPSPRIAVANPIPANTWVRIPTDKSFRLDDQDLGAQTVYLVAARTPPADLAHAIRHESVAPDAEVPAAARAVETELVHVAMAKQGDCAKNARELVLDGDDKDCQVGTRGLVLDDDKPPDAPPARRVRGLTADDVVFVPFTYRHLAAETK